MLWKLSETRQLGEHSVIRQSFPNILCDLQRAWIIRTLNENVHIQTHLLKRGDGCKFFSQSLHFVPLVVQVYHELPRLDQVFANVPDGLTHRTNRDLGLRHRVVKIAQFLERIKELIALRDDLSNQMLLDRIQVCA